MSRWRQKGFVQDSDDEEESQLESQNSRHNASIDGRVGRVLDVQELESRYRRDENDVQRKRSPGGCNVSALTSQEEGEKQERVSATPSKRISGLRPTPSPITPQFAYNTRSEPAESPDPLQSSQTPKTRPSGASASSQLLGSPIFQLASSLPDTLHNYDVAISSQILGSRTEIAGPAIKKNVQGNGTDVLGEFGIAPLSDNSDDDPLSDPPSDLESPPTQVAFTAPHRRTAVQVVIPSSTALQQHLAEQVSGREFRQRKPIQLHPYALDFERYRREVQSRGLKPVARERSPYRPTAGNDAETQEEEFNPNRSPSSSPPETEIPVSLSIVPRPRTGVSKGGSTVHPASNPARRLPSTHLHLPPATKRRRLNFSSTQAAAAPASLSVDRSMRRDLWSIPPNSPPYSSSPPLPGNASARRLNTLRVTTPGPNLPTPSTSSVFQDETRPFPDEDSDPIPHSVRRSGGELRRPARIVLSDSSTSASETSIEPEHSDNELRKVGRKFKGVLPASWLRFDKQTQDRRKAQAREQEMMRMNKIHSPEPAEPQRGVAQRVAKRISRPRRLSTSNTPSRGVVLILDESDSEPAAPVAHQAHIMQNSVDAASALAAMLDDRYANNDSLDMENDRLHLPTLAGTGTGTKRKRQTKLTDVLGKRKKTRTSNGVARASGLKKTSSSAHPRRKQHINSAHRSPLPAMSVIDLDLSPSDRLMGVPQFLKIARRQALHRPDLARQSPSTKHIRLHNARDTEDANATLRNWRKGILKPKAGVNPSRQNGKQPLTQRHNDQQLTQGPPAADIEPMKDFDQQSDAGTRISLSQRRANISSGLHIFKRTSTQKTNVQQRNKKGACVKQGRKGAAHKVPLPFRTAQLEGDEKDFGYGHRKLAFEKGLQQAERQYGLQLPESRSHINPQLARYLADADKVLPSLPTADDTGESPVTTSAKQLLPHRKRRIRKAPAQRIDVDAREYRQPSEPAVHEILDKNVPNQVQPAEQEVETLLLEGLGPHGTRYPITFDVHSLAPDTYFHSTTFIGSDDFRRALTTGSSDGRDYDESAGYCTITCGTLSARCGPWNDETSSRLQDVTRGMVMQQVNDASTSDMLVNIPSDVVDHYTRSLRSLIGYISAHLSFLDPVDRRSFVETITQIIRTFFDGISAAHGAFGVQGQATESSRGSILAMAYLLVMSIQVHHIAQHSTVSPNSRMETTSLIKSISQNIVAHLVRGGVSELSVFLEQNQRHKAREDGVRESDMLVEATVICMLSLESIDMSGSGFWDHISNELCSMVAKASSITSFDSMWATLFTILPFIEFDVSGIPVKSRREVFQADNWTCIRDLLKRLFELYPNTYRKHSTSLNEYVRTTLARCHRLIKHWHWERPELMLSATFDFFGKNGLKQLRREASNGSVSLLDNLATEQNSAIEPNDNSFHIALKCLAIGLQGMKKSYAEKKIRSFVFRTLPNHGRAYPKDQPLDEESLVALRNHHDLLSVLYWAAPPQCRPKLDHIRELVSHESSHREACRLSVRAWANLTTFQLSTKEPYASAKPFALWHKDIMHQTLKQYRLAKVEADDYLKSGVLDGTTGVSAVMVRQTMERNQEQVIATLRDCIAGMRRAVQKGCDQTSLAMFLMDSDIVQLLELPHLEDRRLVNVIRDTLELFRDYATTQITLSSKEVSQGTSEESQDYGDFPDLEDFDNTHSGPAPKQLGLDFVQTPLWHLLSNAFGAESSPDDNLLMNCVDTWVRIAQAQVALGQRAWPYYIDSFSQVSWSQLRQTDQTRKFEPYFMAALVDCDPSVYEEHRHEFIQALLLSLTERESMLRFQHRLMAAIARTGQCHPLLQNLPFFRKLETGEFDITSDTLRTRRLALISSIFSNMRDDVQATFRRDPMRTIEVRRSYAAMLKDFMTTMRFNYQQLQQGTTVTGAYVEFVQKIVQFLKQYTNDICPVLPFFTDSVAFPLPAGDPTYVVARLCGYAPKVAEAGTAKQLSVFIQTVVQQAAADNQQPYLVNQLKAALCTEETPLADRIALRSTLLQNIFPVYLEDIFSSSTAFLITQPVLRALPSILETMVFDLRIMQSVSLSSTIGSLIAISHAFVRGSERLLDNPYIFRQPHILLSLSYMLEVMSSIIPLVEYICSRTTSTTGPIKPQIVTYMQNFSVFVTEMLQDKLPDSIPSYEGDAHLAPPDQQQADLLAFCKRGLQEGLESNWSESQGAISFGQGHARREVIFNISTLEEERSRLVAEIGAFQVIVQNVYEEEECGIKSTRNATIDVIV